MLPEIRQRMRERDGFEVQDYGDFSRPERARGGRGAARGAPERRAGAPAGSWCRQRRRARWTRRGGGGGSAAAAVLRSSR